MDRLRALPNGGAVRPNAPARPGARTPAILPRSADRRGRRALLAASVLRQDASLPSARSCTAAPARGLQKIVFSSVHSQRCARFGHALPHFEGGRAAMAGARSHRGIDAKNRIDPLANPWIDFLQSIERK